MATRPSAPNRASTSKSITSPLRLTPTTLLSNSATSTGSYPVTLGARSIIQIRARLFSTQGPLIIGDSCIISERASIGATSSSFHALDADSSPTHTGTTLGPYVLVESGAVVEATLVGASSIIESGARLGKGSKVGAGCKICSGVEVGEDVVIEDGMVAYGNGWGEWRKEQGFEPLRLRRAWVDEMAGVLRRGWTGK